MRTWTAQVFPSLTYVWSCICIYAYTDCEWEFRPISLSHNFVSTAQVSPFRIYTYIKSHVCLYLWVGAQVFHPTQILPTQLKVVLVSLYMLKLGIKSHAYHYSSHTPQDPLIYHFLHLWRTQPHDHGVLMGVLRSEENYQISGYSCIWLEPWYVSDLGTKLNIY